MGFLSSMLPMIEGAAVMAGGAAMGVPIDPMTAAAIVGTGNYAASGSLRKGITAGMGAYGGASVAGGLSELGTQAGANAAGANANAAAQQATQDQLARAEALGHSAEMGGVAENARIASTMPTMTPEMLAEESAQAANKVGMPNFGAPNGVNGTPFNASTQAIQANPYGAGFDRLTQPGGISALSGAMQQAGGASLGKAGLAAAAPMLAGFMVPQNKLPTPAPSDANMGQRYSYSPGATNPTPAPDVPSYESGMTQNFGRQQRYFTPTYTPISDTQAKDLYHYAGGGPIEQMSNANAIGQNTGYPQADITGHAYATPWQTPMSQNVVTGTADTGVDSMTGEENRFAAGGDVKRFDLGGLAALAAKVGGGGANIPGVPEGYTYDPETQQYTKMAAGGLSAAASHLGGYSDGGRLLKGPGDGVSDSIPAVIGHKQPARLADGEFVVPARIVSELGNGSTEAGARRLYAMMDRVQKARKKTTGKDKVATNTKADKYLPA